MSDPFDYLASRADADGLISDFGQPILIRRANTTGGTPWEPTQGTPTDYPTNAAIVILPRWYPAFADGGDVLRTDRLAYVAAGPLGAIVPTPFDLLVALGSGKIYRIIDSKPIDPAGIAVVHVLQLRV